jgi:hypothetical protein
MREIFLLTAAIMGIIGIFTLWGSILVKERLGGAQNSTPITTCQAAVFNFYSGKYDRSTKNLYFVLENKRSIELKLDKLYLFYPKSMVTFELNNTLEGNILKSINVNGVEDGFSSGTIKTNCPDVSVDFSYSQLIVNGEIRRLSVLEYLEKLLRQLRAR